ncbi:glycosyltransferase family 4 protein [Roseomonas sp. SSH11]|uniref:Glycosyltransferase family 4 protein n=1 Tax=Pararoseomonas baculiformis TaxID=2820812 RepID=A0ABS4A9C3_9PROT|nr:glycosyltransferase family 1 protein [Pararoseomonas baculiformis]MBP0443185.1 glycosyltransferase family 4 protein [Pararoseomonas baculiformis]
MRVPRGEEITLYDTRASAPAPAPHVVLDVSRLLACGTKAAPSGIDRVEIAYARRWATMPEAGCTFVAQALAGDYVALPWRAVVGLIANLTKAWSHNDPDFHAARRARRISVALRWRVMAGIGKGTLARRLKTTDPKVFLLVSHRALERERPIQAMRDAGCAFVPLIHDLIPATHPEYARPGQADRHMKRISTTAALADAIIVNSAHTAAALRPHLGTREIPPHVTVAPLGIEPPPAASPTLPAEPYFVILGTIEPRKNHLLLLHLWRDLAGRMGRRTPHLLVVGRRGWENENVVDILERCEALRGTVREMGQVPDREVWQILRGARALLFPSFAEGYGLPLAEALALGVPAICSDLPALREVGGHVPDYLDPLDGIAWRAAILDYADPASPARNAQLARLSGWRAPRWDSHFARVDNLLATLARRRSPATLQAALPGWLRSRPVGPGGAPT